MTTLVDRTVAALHGNHDTLAALVPTLSEEQLTGRSGATECTAAQALSHRGSGAEIARTPIASAVGQQVEEEENQSIWHGGMARPRPSRRPGSSKATRRTSTLWRHSAPSSATA